MGNGYSVDLRKAALKLSEEGHSKETVARLLGVGVSSVYRWQRKQRNGEGLASKPRGRYESKLDLGKLKRYVHSHSDHTLLEISTALGYSVTGIWYRLKQLKITLKKSHPLSRKMLGQQSSVSSDVEQFRIKSSGLY